MKTPIDPGVPRRIGRPPLDQEGRSTQVTVRVTRSTYDAIYAAARAQRLDVAQVIRDAIQYRLAGDQRPAL